MNRRFLSSIIHLFQLDLTLLYAMSARLWQALAGPVTIVLIIRGLSLEEQGIYYGLASIMGIQVFFELGLLNILVGQAAHLSTNLSTIEGRMRMVHLLTASGKWFFGLSLAYATIAIALGWTILAGKTTSIPWQGPLVCLSIIGAATLALSSSVAILEGAGYRDSVYRIRLFQMLSGALVVWFSLLIGWKLWALVASALTQLLWCLLLVGFVHRDFFRQFSRKKLKHSNSSPPDHRSHRDTSSTVAQPSPPSHSQTGLSWIHEVLPLQWRVAVISLVYHAATQFFTLIILQFHGKAEAGRLGMTLTISAAIQGMALTWLNTKFPLISHMHGSGEREKAGTLWRRSTVISLGLVLLAFMALFTIVALLPLAQRQWELRFVTPVEILVLGLGCLANHAIAVQSLYVLSRKDKPFLVPAVIGFSSTGVAALLGGYWFSTTGIVWGYALTTALITLPGHTWAYRRYRLSI
jgi:O-antigen/teichoic acid export membrane protein